MKQLREYRKMCKREGFNLLAIEKGRKHCRLVFEAGFVIAGITPSDTRNMMNVLGGVRRLHR